MEQHSVVFVSGIAGLVHVSHAGSVLLEASENVSVTEVFCLTDQTQLGMEPNIGIQ